MIPQDDLIRASRTCLEAGVRILQGFRLGGDDRAHVAALLEFMAPEDGTLWADIGCGFGAVADLMQEMRPDLGFVLINNNAFQLERAPGRFVRLNADMCAIPLPDGFVDGCMFLYALCHAEGFGAALQEAARITRPGGSLFVFDYERLTGDNRLMVRRLYAYALPFAQIRSIAKASGWDVTMHTNPPGSDAVFRRLCDDEAEYEQIFNDLRPVVWKAVKL
jgi:ubiquinone/menaquinone biosynthesis C-methylase UbiE